MTLQLQFILVPAATALLLIGWLAFRARFAHVWAKNKGHQNPKYSYIDYGKDDFPSFYTKWVLAVLAWLMVIVTICIAIPFNPTYWMLYEHRGTIATVSNRFVSGSGDVTDSTYTLTLKGDPTPYVVTDSRILGLKTGATVDMTCSVQWIYGGADQNNCYLRSFAMNREVGGQS